MLHKPILSLGRNCFISCSLRQNALGLLLPVQITCQSRFNSNENNNNNNNASEKKEEVTFEEYVKKRANENEKSKQSIEALEQLKSYVKQKDEKLKFEVQATGIRRILKLKQNLEKVEPAVDALVPTPIAIKFPNS